MADSIYQPPRKKSPMKTYEFCYGAGLNWVDLSDNTIYFIEEYKEAVEKNENPNGIRYQTVDGEEGYISELKLKDKMTDPEPDPRTAPETPEEHRKNW